MIKKESKRLGFNYLIEKKKTKLAKCSYSKLTLQTYLKTKNIFSRKQKLLFKFRTHMINVAKNFGQDNNCPLGCPILDSQEHLFECSKLNNQDHNIKYSDIFSDKPHKFTPIINVAQQILRKREELIIPVHS